MDRRKPAWAEYEKDIHSDDPDKAMKAAEAFQQTRLNEMKNDSSARKWEMDRRASIAKEKPQWVKERIKNEQDAYNRTLDKYLNGGIVMGKFIPAPGFLLVKPIHIDKTKSGLYLPEGTVTEDVQEPPRGIVVAVGRPRTYPNGAVSEAPCEVGDVVSFKWHTMVILYNEEKHNFLSFEDIFGVIKEEA